MKCHGAFRPERRKNHLKRVYIKFRDRYRIKTPKLLENLDKFFSRLDRKKFAH